MATINTDIAQKIDIIARENNTSIINLIITDSSGNPFNFIGYYIDFIVYDESGTHISKDENSGITSTESGGDPTSDGKLTITLSASDMSINSGTYKHKLIFKKNVVLNNVSTNIETKTWMYGKFKINND
jgi:hypothetical protein